MNRNDSVGEERKGFHFTGTPSAAPRRGSLKVNRRDSEATLSTQPVSGKAGIIYITEPGRGKIERLQWVKGYKEKLRKARWCTDRRQQGWIEECPATRAGHCYYPFL